MALKLITAPTSEPLTLVEAKAHLRVDSSDNDTMISALIKAARSNCEGWTGRAFMEQTWELVLDEFPTALNGSSSEAAILIPKPPLMSVIQVAYDDIGGNEVIIDPINYFVDTASEPGWVAPAGVTSWPSTIDAINCVRVRFRAGYTTLDSPADTPLPEDIKAGIKLTLGSLYEHRELQVVGTIATKLPFGVEQLLRHHRVLLGMA